ncbi:hypothetical protein [Micromonospora profundi]|uniref:hypothetical protein n=1 Tax=Micromonospora profundi TaxID=1420889 RepID=UPI0036603DEF
MTDDQDGRFVVQADRDGELTLEHWSPGHLRATDPWCWWETRIRNGTDLSQLGQLAADHMAEAHRTVITLDADACATGAPETLTRSDLEHVAAVTRGLNCREIAVKLHDDA